MMFWGLWLFPFGWLVYRSQFLPRALGALILLAGVAYLLSGAVAIALPEYRQVVSRTMMPLYFGEVPIIFWLMIKGAREAREALAWEARGATP
jgi:predicted transporter